MKKQAGMNLSAGYLVWSDGYKYKLSKDLDTGRYLLILMERSISKRMPRVLEISEEDARLAWTLIDEKENQMTKDWFFEGRR
jgi:hypothetical protein